MRSILVAWGSGAGGNRILSQSANYQHMTRPAEIKKFDKRKGASTQLLLN